jgi:hypothetical protein
MLLLPPPVRCPHHALTRCIFVELQAGGFVSDGRVCGIMEVSRSFGDAALKSKGARALCTTWVAYDAAFYNTRD